METLRTLSTLTFLATMLTGCGAINGVLKAAPAADSGFLGTVSDYAKAEPDSPFHRVWYSESGQQLGDMVENERPLYIAPINLEYLTDDEDEVLDFSLTPDGDDDDAVDALGRAAGALDA